MFTDFFTECRGEAVKTQRTKGFVDPTQQKSTSSASSRADYCRGLMEQENGSAFSMLFLINKLYVSREVQMHAVRVSPGARSELHVSKFQVFIWCSIPFLCKLQAFRVLSA